ncbi:MAG: TIGR03032 family protein [Cyclobacteriaceae bacterium]
MKQPPAPFSCSHSPSFSQLLHDLGCTLAITTYQAGKLIFISATDPDKLVQLPRSFEKPMGIAIRDNAMAIATRHEVVMLRNANRMAKRYPKQPNTYDALYLPRATYYTGELDIHDLHWSDDEVLAVNTRFSCLSVINDDFNFTPVWQPAFITTLTPTDKCHLNGIAIDNGLAYASALAKSDTDNGWRPVKATGGIIIDIRANEIVTDGLPMPHSPRVYDGKLYVLLSATGELAVVDRNSGKCEPVKRFQGFVRGMDRIGDYVFIGVSKLRKTSTTFGDLPIAKVSPICGIAALHLPTLSIVGHLQYVSSVEEIFDVKVLPGLRRPGILNHLKPDHRLAVTSPTDDYWAINSPEA